MKTALFFTGQGSQVPGMGRDLYEAYPAFAKMIDMAGENVDFDLKALMFEGDQETLSQTQYAQPVLAAFALGVMAVLAEHGYQPDYTAGLSLGEYCALTQAGVFTPQELIRLTAFRGKAMADAAKGLDTKMIAVMGLGAEQTEEACRQAREKTGHFVAVSNYNAEGQNVISGLTDAALEAAALAKAAGARRCVPLKVSTSFHTPFMEPASKALHEYFQTIEFKKPSIPVVCNLTGLPMAQDEDIPHMLEQQILCPVRLAQSIRYMESAGVTDVIEAGPGKTIAGFIKRTAKGMKCQSVTDAASLEKILDSLKENI